MAGIEDLYKEYYKSLSEVTQDFGEPDRLSNKEMYEFLLSILKRRNPEFRLEDKNTFYLVLNIKEARFIPFDEKKMTVPNLEKVLGYKDDIDFDYFLRKMIPVEILSEYLNIGLSAYREVGKHKDIIQILKHSFNTDLFLEDAKGEVYRFYQEAIALQLDKDNNLVSHLNRYTRRTKVRGSIEMSLGIDAMLNDEPENTITEQIYDRFNKLEYKTIKSGIQQIEPYGDRIWRSLYEYLYLTNLGQVANSSIVLQNIITTENSLYDGQGYNEGLLRNDMRVARTWLNNHFFILEHKELHSTEKMIIFLRKNKYFRQIIEPYISRF